jgi:hypothetical protein
MNYNKIKLYWKTLLFKRGITIALVLTYDCQLHCPYCILKATGGYPQSDTSTFLQWKDFIDRFPVRIKEVYLTGGEPTLYPHFVELTNYLLDKGYHVTVFSNLLDRKLLWIQMSYRFLITATYHHHTDSRIFVKNYNEITKLHRVDVHELGYKALSLNSKVMPLVSDPNEIGGYNFTVTPDRKIYIGCKDAVIDKTTYIN